MTTHPVTSRGNGPRPRKSKPVKGENTAQRQKRNACQEADVEREVANFEKKEVMIWSNLRANSFAVLTDGDDAGVDAAA